MQQHVASPQGAQRVGFQVDAPAEASPQATRPPPPPDAPAARVPSYAQPRHLRRRQPPLLERVQQFVDQFGRSGSDAETIRSTSYYASQIVADAAMVKGMPSRGSHTTRTVRRLAEERQALAALKKDGPPARATESGARGGGKALRQLRERMHRATQGLPITPLPSRLLATFGPKDPTLEPPDAAEHNALTWLGLLRIKKCGLCNVSFAVDALVTSVSVKAIRHLRNEWEVRRKAATDLAAQQGASASPQDGQECSNVPLAESHHSSRGGASQGDCSPTLWCNDRTKTKPHPDVAAHAYTATRVCRYCAQFFGVFLGASFDDAPSGQRRSTAPRRQAKAQVPQDTTSSNSSESDNDDDDFEEEDDDEAYQQEDPVVSSAHGESLEPSSRSGGRQAGDATSTGSDTSRSSSSSASAGSSRSSSASSERASDTGTRRDVHVAALQPPSRPVTATRASLLRRSHHYHVMHEAPHSNEDANDMRVQDKAKRAAKAAETGKRGKPVAVPVADVFVLGPSDSEVEAVATAPTGTTPSRDARDEFDGDNAASAAADAVQSAHMTPSPSPAEHQQQRTTGGPAPHAAWSGDVRVLVMACQAYQQHSIGMPVAVVPMATRLGHWCAQVFHRSDVRAASDAETPTEHVQVLCNDDVTASAVYSFLESCVAERAAPLMCFLGLVEHREGAFGDVALHLTNPSSAAIAWPPACQQRLADAAANGGQRKGGLVFDNPPATHDAHSRQPGQRPPSSARGRNGCKRTPALNPLTSTGHVKLPTNTAAAGVSTSNVDGRPTLSVGAIDAICGAMGLPLPMLVVDSCFGPLMARTEVLTMVHPARPTLPSQTAAAAAPAPIACGCVVDALTAVVEAMIGEDASIPTVVATARGIASHGRLGASPLKADTQWKGCDWGSVVGRLHASGDAGIVAQTLFHSHMTEDESLGPLVVTCPRHPMPVHHVQGNRVPLHRPLPRSASHDGSVFAFPIASTAVEMHVESSAASASAGRGVAAVDDESLLRSAAARVSQTFAMRLSPRHNVQRMSNASQQLRLAEALQAVLRLDPATAAMNALNFNIAVVLSGHVTVFVSSVDQLLLQQAASVLASHRTHLGECGWGIQDYGFVVAREASGGEHLSLKAVMSQNSSKKSQGATFTVYVLDIHTRE